MLLTLDDARALLRIDGGDNDALIQQTLNAAVSYLKEATGHDWNADDVPHPVAQTVAGMLLIQWFDQPGGFTDSSFNQLSYGITNLMKQLQCLGGDES